MKSDYPILVLCEHLEVSPSGYYDWRNRRTAPGPRALANQTLAQQIKVIHAQSRQTYGSPRIVNELHKQGRHHGRNRVARLMQAAGLCGRQRRRYRVQTTDSNHDQPIAPNRLAQVAKAIAPNQLWAADITYVETREGWLYLAGILDLYSRKIVGWAMCDHLRTDLPLAALRMAISAQRPGAGLIHHSDRGVQYASEDYRTVIRSAGFQASMSRKGNCYDNAPMESFFHTLKTERVHHRVYATRDEARRDLFGYIEGFYNRIRRHSAIGYISPIEMELKAA